MKRKMEKESSVSVVVPIKKETESLVVCLRSVLKQSFPADEIFVIGSLLDILATKKQLTSQERMKIEFIEFYGDKSEARNMGVMNSSGSFILYLDHDMRLEKNVLEKCFEMDDGFDALIIPEKGWGNKFWQRVKKLEKRLIMHDLHTVTPRLFRKDFFQNELPFNPSFGLLDEWGLNQKLMFRKAKVGIVQAYITVIEKDFSLKEEMKKKFRRGLYMPIFFRVDKKEAYRRMDPVRRGILFYGKKLGWLLKEPLVFSGLLFLKMLHFLSFYTGYLAGRTFSPGYLLGLKLSEQTLLVHDKLGGQYSFKMYDSSNWGRYVDKKEQEQVRGLLKESYLERTFSVLDVGMGSGRWSQFFLTLGAKKVVGIDFSKAMVKAAREKIQDKRFKAIKGQMESPPVQGASMNVVFSFRSFKYADNPSQVVLEFRRVLVPGGVLVLEVPNKSLLNLFLKFSSLLVLRIKGAVSPFSKPNYFAKIRMYSADEIDNLLKNCNFKIKKRVGIFVLPSVSPPKLIDRSLSPILIFLDQLLQVILPTKLFSRSWLVLAKKEGG